MSNDLWPILPALFAAGLAGSGHCFGMCGGVAALAGSSAAQVSVVWINLARLCSYVVIGALGALLIQLGISSSEQILQISALGDISRILSGLILIGLGCNVVGWRVSNGVFGRISDNFWQKLQPLSRRLLPINKTTDALLFGLLWGWLPCGLIYAVLPAAWLRGNPLEAGLMLLCFGLGTLPSMLSMGMASAKFRLWLKNPGMKRFIIASIILAGLWLLILPVLSLFETGHQH